MADRGPNPTEFSENYEGLVTILVELARASGLPVERQAARRMLAEAQATWPGSFADQWWKWVLEAGQTLGLSLRATDVSLVGALDLAGSHLPAATAWSPDDSGWLVITDGRGHRLCVLAGRSGGSPKWVHTDRFEASLKDVRDQMTQRWVVAQPFHLLPPEAKSRPLTPLRRLWGLLAPESSDIWVVIVLALFVGVLAIAVPIAGQQLVRTVTFGTLYQPILILSLVLLGFLTFMAGLQALHIFVVELIQRRLFARLVADVSFRLPRVPFLEAQSHYTPELVNRFFDLMTVQKVVAGLLVDGLALVLATLVGLALLAFYHPFLLGYDVVLLGLMALSIVVVGRGGTRTAIAESVAKYQTASWLEDVARSPVAFKLYGAADFSIDRADRLTAEYLVARQAHFRVLVRQFLCILGLQALATTVLLGLGGYLVMRNQLTLGQLVAAELVVTNIVGAFAKLTKHIEGFYDLMAGVEKIGHLVDLPVEPARGLMTMASSGPAQVEIRGLCIAAPHEEDHHGGSDAAVAAHDPHHVLDGVTAEVPAGGSLAVVGPPGSGKTLLLETLFGLRHQAGGGVLMDGIDPDDLRRDVLRRHVAFAGGPEVISGTIAENVHLSRADVDTAHVRDAVSVVGLTEELRALVHGLETPLSPTGRPLTQSQIVRLMLARAIASRPRLLLIDGLLDSLSDEQLEQFWERLENSEFATTVIVTTGRQAVVDLCSNVLDLSEYSPSHHADPTDLPQRSDSPLPPHR